MISLADVFKANPNFLEDEKAYENLKRNILGDESSEDEAGSDEDGDEDDDEEETDDEEEEEERMKIKDETETNLINLRRTIYLTIMSSVDFEEAGHKLLKIKLEPGQEVRDLFVFLIFWSLLFESFSCYCLETYKLLKEVQNMEYPHICKRGPN